MRPIKILVSAGEASGDMYAAQLVKSLRRRLPRAEFFGCTGPRMRGAGVRTVADAASLSVVGLIEVVSHIPRIYGEYRTLLRAAESERPDLAILTDSPDFHLRVARRLRRMDVPVVCLVAPQVWAWRQGRVKALRRDLRRVLCIFPFELPFFERHGVPATYIGHPLTRMVGTSASREEFLESHGIPADRPLVVLLPGSRVGEARRHLPALLDAVRRLGAHRPMSFVMAVPEGLPARAGRRNFGEPISGSPIQLVEGQTWNAIAHADLALAASGTVAVETALLGTPMVTFYKVTPLTWQLGRFLVKVPFYTMVNLVAKRRVVPELIQREMSGGRLAEEALRLLEDPAERARMKSDLAEIRQILSGDMDPMEAAAGAVLAELGSEGEEIFGR